MNGRYVVDENGERIAMLLNIDDYERLVVQHHVPSAEEVPKEDEEDFDPEEAERRITEFITSAEELPGRTVAELAEDIARLMRAAWRDLETIISGNLHNKVLATQLFLSQRARGLQADDPEQWRLFAATTLLARTPSLSGHPRKTLTSVTVTASGSVDCDFIKVLRHPEVTVARKSQLRACANR